MIELESMAMRMPEVVGHPNRVGFRGVLTVVDIPSDRAPSGAKGKRVVLTRPAAEAALPSLMGMALDYAPTFDRHDVRRKVGVITEADVVGRNLEIGGYLYAKDFPEVVEEIRKNRPRTSDFRPRAPDLALRGISVRPRTPREAGQLRVSLAAAVARIRSLAAAVPKGLAASTPASVGVRNGSELGMSFEVTNVKLANPQARVWTLTSVLFTGAAILRREKAAFQSTWIELVG